MADAESGKEVVHKLIPPPEGELAYKIFIHAQRFGKAALFMGEQLKGGDLDFALPCAVMGAFVLELYLKCLVSIETGKPPPEKHEFSILFDSLSQASKSKIKDFFDQNPPAIRKQFEAGIFPGKTPEEVEFLKKMDVSFEGLLKAAENSFQQFRYACEEKMVKKPPSFQMGPMIQGVINVIEEHRPNWVRQGK